MTIERRPQAGGMGHRRRLCQPRLADGRVARSGRSPRAAMTPLERAMRARVKRCMRVWMAVSKARLILTCGLPGAGKTTLARQLAADRDAVRLTKDEWMWALGSSPWDAPTQERVERELWHLAQEVLRLGLSV